MKAVFLNNGIHIGRVYREELQQELAGIVELIEETIRQDEMEQYADVLAGAEAVFSTWGMPALTAGDIARYLPNLRIVFYGAGSVQSFARPFLQRGIRVVSAWAANAVPVIEFAASMIQLSLKGFLPALSTAKADWQNARLVTERHPGCYGASVGLLGLGMIGRGVAERLKLLDVDVAAYDPYAPDELFRRLGVRRANSILEAFQGMDAVSNHIANLPATQEILRYEHFNALPEHGAFINTGRNAQVHVPGLVRAFTEVPTRTAFFDVTDPDEPPSADNPLLALPNAWFTPHIAGTTGRELGRMGAYMVEECKRYLNGEPLKWEVTEKMLETMA